jgi:hypothetical protein
LPVLALDEALLEGLYPSALGSLGEVALMVRGPEEFPIAMEVHRASDRAAVIVSVAYLDEILLRRVQIATIEDKDCRHKLFKPSGPLGPFQNRVDLGYLLRMYSKEARDDLRLIGEIRNRFAHFAGVSDFSDKENRQKCERLTAYERVLGASPIPHSFPSRPFDQATARKHFIDNVSTIANLLSQQTEGKAAGMILV